MPAALCQALKPSPLHRCLTASGLHGQRLTKPVTVTTFAENPQGFTAASLSPNESSTPERYDAHRAVQAVTFQSRTTGVLMPGGTRQTDQGRLGPMMRAMPRSAVASVTSKMFGNTGRRAGDRDGRVKTQRVLNLCGNDPFLHDIVCCYGQIKTIPCDGQNTYRTASVLPGGSDQSRTISLRIGSRKRGEAKTGKLHGKNRTPSLASTT